VIYLVDPKGRFAGSLDGAAAPAPLAERLKQLIGED